MNSEQWRLVLSFSTFDNYILQTNVVVRQETTFCMYCIYVHSTAPSSSSSNCRMWKMYPDKVTAVFLLYTGQRWVCTQRSPVWLMTSLWSREAFVWFVVAFLSHSGFQKETLIPAARTVQLTGHAELLTVATVTCSCPTNQLFPAGSDGLLHDSQLTLVIKGRWEMVSEMDECARVVAHATEGREINRKKTGYLSRPVHMFNFLWRPLLTPDVSKVGAMVFNSCLFNELLSLLK